MIENVTDITRYNYGIYISCEESSSNVELSLNYGSVESTLENLRKGWKDLFYLETEGREGYANDAVLTVEEAVALRDKLSEMLHQLGVE
jgi:hypothetical protein